jgi:hypothetical protein
VVLFEPGRRPALGHDVGHVEGAVRPGEGYDPATDTTAASTRIVAFAPRSLATRKFTLRQSV